ncbi:MAG: 5-carboxymethyl-2-hydroxymuconate isomerase [Hyphomonas sp. BRH_c22]|uniref:fumarylacetoacetate hydrolase family protein n=1 Tax=Hyphomonas sp. BRH_c22 TaxID=1629710 RepID=UPI0005F204EF|nr:fumarylacetoacetate hydrolase family protein [Hyphomonas sp. BRH_c22]KJS35044.1 MAG: 5-carboxymethyl-2-hydroxymuconate isomerase [Hyphomonas sp. BRH_c22]
MHLLTFLRHEKAEPGVLVDASQIVSLSSIAADMIALIDDWEAHSDKVMALMQQGERIALDRVRLLAPVPRPGKIFAIGLNYADHVEESGMDMPPHQIWFTKAATAVNGPFDPIEIPRSSFTTDYEVEMVAVIGKGGRHISTEDAPSHIFGYCVGNDVSERMWQMRTPQYSLGKSFDTHAPFGPWITTSAAAGDVHALDIRCSVNGEVRQSSNTRHLIFNVWQQVAELSQAMTLEPGDVIFTGTPGGVGGAMKPPQFLKPGDVVRCEVEGLGSIEATCRPE